MVKKGEVRKERVKKGGSSVGPYYSPPPLSYEGKTGSRYKGQT
jgi:hypothetical protein